MEEINDIVKLVIWQQIILLVPISFKPSYISFLMIWSTFFNRTQCIPKITTLNIQKTRISYEKFKNAATLLPKRCKQIEVMNFRTRDWKSLITYNFGLERVRRYSEGANWKASFQISFEWVYLVRVIPWMFNLASLEYLLKKIWGYRQLQPLVFYFPFNFPFLWKIPLLRYLFSQSKTTLQRDNFVE